MGSQNRYLLSEIGSAHQQMEETTHNSSLELGLLQMSTLIEPHIVFEIFFAISEIGILKHFGK